MKIQELAIIFIIIILPISLLLSEYTQFQIQTIKLQTEYDARLTSATYDAIKAFQLNAANSTTSDLSNSKMRDLEASIKTFRNSIMTGFGLNGYTEEDLNNYIPALVYTLYDGFYIYSPYENTHDESGNRIDGNLDSIYGLKPYINYSCRYVKGNIDVVITYALDNYITVQGQIGNDYVNKSGYLIDGITYDEITGKVIYNGIEIKTEHLKEELLGSLCSYVKVNGTKYYLYNNQIVYILNGELKVQASDPKDVTAWKILIENNDNAKTYYRKAYQFTEWLKNTDLDNLTYGDAIDEIIAEDGSTSIGNVWNGNGTFIFRDVAGTNIENELSNFNQHRLAVIRHKIETNLAIAIANYNNYSGASSTNVFQMPELKENEWDNLTHNISVISFLQGLHIGGKVYNGYSLVTNSESKEVVTEDNIYIVGEDLNQEMLYCKIGDKGIEEGTPRINAHRYYGVSEYGTSNYGFIQSAGRLNLDFERSTLKDNNIYYYYYPLAQYNASYDSIVMQNNLTTYDDIYAYVNDQSDELKEAFYTALGREREGKYRANTTINYYSVLLIGYAPSEKNFNDAYVSARSRYIRNKLNEDENIQSTMICGYGSDGVQYINQYINEQKGNYDLIIMDSSYWGLSREILNELKDTNIMTIGNGYTETTIPEIIQSNNLIRDANAKATITDLGIQKLNDVKNISEIGEIHDSDQYGITFKPNVEVLYTAKYNKDSNNELIGEFDLIGCLQKGNYKWIHSQLIFNYAKLNHIEVLKTLVKYAVN